MLGFKKKYCFRRLLEKNLQLKYRVVSIMMISTLNLAEQQHSLSPFQDQEDDLEKDAVQIKYGGGCAMEGYLSLPYLLTFQCY